MYLRLQHTTPIHVPLRLTTETAHDLRAQVEYLGLGIAFGALLLLIIAIGAMSPPNPADRQLAAVVWIAFVGLFVIVGIFLLPMDIAPKLQFAMIGLVLVAMLLIMAVFADFFAPLDPKLTLLPYGPPTTLSFVDADGTFSFRPVYYPIVETGEFDPRRRDAPRRAGSHRGPAVGPHRAVRPPPPHHQAVARHRSDAGP